MYAFPVSYVHKFEVQTKLQCLGLQKVEMKDGGIGYRYIMCSEELSNPPVYWKFYIDRMGKIRSTTTQ